MIISFIQNYLKSIYFNKNQIKNEEENLYQKSVQFEPNEKSTPPRKSSLSYFSSFRLKTPQKNSSIIQLKTKSLTPNFTPSTKSKFQKGHKKTHSLNDSTKFKFG